ncbi:oligosaccharide flippase family protein [Sporosarcina sp. A2]|uniref:oligosaccharide flippase family protein n=1 Tax=Sporosarcina sp. A2 TaxID=3393449 RepID=UPI003D7A35C2
MSQIKMGAVLSYLALILSIIITLVFTPIIIKTLGQAEYGVYSLMAAFVGYLTILDMGLGNAIVRYVARTRANNDRQEESKLSGMFLILFTVLGVLVGIIGVVMYYQIDLLFGEKLEAEELKLAKQMAIILIANFAISFPLSVFGALIQAHERFIYLKLIGIIRSVIIPLVTVPLLFMGHGSVMMVTISSLVNIACLLINVVYCFKKLRIKVGFGQFDKKLLKEILIYSSFIFLNAIMDKIYWSTDQIILGSINGANQVAVYAISMQFIIIYMSISTAISGLFLPKVSIMDMKGAGSKEFSDLFIKVGRIQAHLMGLILGSFIIVGQIFIHIWVGDSYIDAFYIVLVIMIPLTISLVQNTGISILQAKNLHAFRSVAFLIVATLNVFVSIPIAKEYGALGVAMITGMTLFINQVIILNPYYYFKLKINIFSFWRNISKSIFVLIISIIITLFVRNILAVDSGIIELLLMGIIYAVIYCNLTWFFAMNKYEKGLVVSLRNRR